MVGIGALLGAMLSPHPILRQVFRLLCDLVRVAKANTHPRGAVPAALHQETSTMPDIETSSFVSDAETAIETMAVQAVQAYITRTYGAAVSEAGLKLINDVVALAAKPSLNAALGDLPDVIKLIGTLAPAAP